MISLVVTVISFVPCWHIEDIVTILAIPLGIDEMILVLMILMILGSIPIILESLHHILQLDLWHHPQNIPHAELFDRSLKKDPTLFTMLQDMVHWDNWSRMFETQVRLQGCSSVIDEHYILTTVDKRKLFERQQLYIYSVFEHLLKIDE